MPFRKIQRRSLLLLQCVLIVLSLGGVSIAQRAGDLVPEQMKIAEVFDLNEQQSTSILSAIESNPQFIKESSEVTDRSFIRFVRKWRLALYDEVYQYADKDRVDAVTNGYREYDEWTTKMCRQMLLAFYDLHLALTEDQLEQIENLLIANWKPEFYDSCRGYLLYGIQNEGGAVEILNLENAKSILDKEQYVTFTKFKKVAGGFIATIDMALSENREDEFTELVDQILRVELESLERFLDLNAGQRQKLSIATKGNISQMAKKWDQICKAGKTVRMRVMDIPDVMSFAMDPPRNQFLSGTAWNKCMISMLNEEQLQRWNDHNRKHDSTLAKALSFLAIESLVTPNRLASNDRIALQDLFVDHVLSCQSTTVYDRYQAIFHVDDERLRSAISAEGYDLIEKRLLAEKQRQNENAR